jgi:hypothetical protein
MIGFIEKPSFFGRLKRWAGLTLGGGHACHRGKLAGEVEANIGCDKLLVGKLSL